MRSKENITKRDYWQEVKQTAEIIKSEYKDRDQPIQEIIHETIDNHRWIIYTCYHTMILDYTDNLEAIDRYALSLEHCDSVRDKIQTIAFYAFKADVKMKVYND